MQKYDSYKDSDAESSQNQPLLLFRNKYRIPSARKVDHDYSGGAYFVTICCKNREWFFGHIVEDGDGEKKMILNDTGKYAEQMLNALPSHNPYASVPLWVVMPNHVHLIVVIDGEKTPYERRGNVETRQATSNDSTARNVETRQATSNDSTARNVETRQATSNDSTTRNVETRQATSLPEPNPKPTNEKNAFMQEIANMQGWLSVAVGGFKSAVTKYAGENNIEFGWQTRFHDHIIRNQKEMNRIAEYIENNVAKWKEDCFYEKPAKQGEAGRNVACRVSTDVPVVNRQMKMECLSAKNEK